VLIFGRTSRFVRRVQRNLGVEWLFAFHGINPLQRLSEEYIGAVTAGFDKLAVVQDRGSKYVFRRITATAR